VVSHFRYRAKDAQGKTHEGFLPAMTATQARKTLLAQFAAVLELTQAEPTSAALASAPKRMKVASDRVAVLYRRMATMLMAGIPLLSVLHFLQKSEEDPHLASALEYVVAGVSAGQMLSSALAAPHLRAVFSPVAQGLIHLGEQTGSLLQVVSRLADLTEVQMRLRRATTSAMTYPAVLTAGIVAMGLFFVLLLGPGDTGLFAMFGGQLPWPTRVLVECSKVLRNPLWMALLLGNVVGVALWLRHLLRTNAGVRMTAHDLALRVPILGTLIKKTVSANMLYVISSSLQVGLPMLQALGLAGKVCTNDRMLADFEQAIDLVTEGHELSGALAQHEVFPPLVTALIQTGQETGHLDSVLGNLCKSYEEDVEMTLDNVTRLAEPVLLAVAGVLAGFLAVATFLPIIELVQKL